MSESKKERALFDSQDRDVHSLPPNQNYGGQQGQFGDPNGYMPVVDNYWTVPPQPYWDPYAGQAPYVPYPPVTYYPPVTSQYPIVGTSPSNPVSKTPANKPTTALPAAPIGRTPRVPTAAYSSLGLALQPTVPIPVQQPVVSTVPMYPSYPPPPPVQQPVISTMPIHPSYLPPPAPPPSYYYRRSQPSPYYRRRRSPPPYDYYDRILPYIRQDERRREREYYDRHHRDDPLVMSYMGRRQMKDYSRYPTRWYH